MSTSRISLKKKVDSSKERELLIDLIMDTDVCKALLPGIVLKDLQTDYSGQVIKWIKSYYKQEHKAPKDVIELIFDQKKKSLEPALASIIEQLLKSLSEEYSTATSTDRKIKQHKDYLKERHSKSLSENINKQIELGNIDRAEKLITNHQPLFIEVVPTVHLSASIASFGEVINKELVKPTMMITPWLMDGSVIEIYAWRGTGKTWLAMIIGLMVARGAGTGTKIGPWEVMHPGGCLYLDGEMGEYLMFSQMRKLKQGLEKSNMNFPLDVICYDKFLKDRGYALNLTKPELREEIYHYLKDHEKYNLLILDNLTSLFSGIDENSKQEWDPYNDWLKKIATLNVATIFVHNSGKSGTQRGTAAREDNINVVLKLTRVGKSQGAYFKIEFEKNRGIPPGIELAPFTLKLIDGENGGLTWQTGDATASTKGGKKISEEDENLIKALLLDKRPQKEITSLTGVSQPKVSGIFQELIDLKLVQRDGKFRYNLTPKGEKSFTQMKHDGVLFGYEEDEEE